jgi:hypothetical protein
VRAEQVDPRMEGEWETDPTVNYRASSGLHKVNDDRPPICATCGVTMVPASLSAREERTGDWICLECEETSEPNMT